MRKIQLCLLHLYYLPVYSGAAIRAHRQAMVMKELEHIVWVLTPRYPGLGNNDVLDGIPIVRTPVYGRSRWQQFFAFMFSASIELVRRRQYYDIVHLYSFGPFDLLPILVAKALGKRVLYQVTMMENEPAILVEKSPLSSLLNIGLCQINGFTVLSTPLLHTFKNTRFENRPLALIPNGVDTQLFSPADYPEKRAIRNGLGLDIDTKYICFVGAVVERKGVDILISAFKCVADQYPRVHLLIVGPDSFIRPGFVDDGYHRDQAFVDTLKQTVDKMGLSHRVTFTGETQLVSELLRASDIFVFPSRREGFPNAVIEAMACGLPSIVSLLNGISKDIITHGVDGYIVNESEPSDYSELILQLLNDEALCNELGLAARRTVEQKFELKQVVRRYEEFCYSLL